MLPEENMESIVERFYAKEELTVEERKMIGVGNIRLNAVRCNRCERVIVSNHRHDFKKCPCGAIAVDGGSWYLKRVGDPNGYVEMSEYYKEREL